MPLSFTADRVQINGPRIDNSLKITFETLEYDQVDLPSLLKLMREGNLKVTVEAE